jgi:excisionase family DNA binding protein
MTVSEAAKEIGLSADAVYDLCRSGALGHRRIGPNRGRIVILPGHVAAYLAASEVSRGVEGPPAQAQKVRSAVRECRPDGKPFRFAK